MNTRHLNKELTSFYLRKVNFAYIFTFQFYKEILQYLFKIPSIHPFKKELERTHIHGNDTQCLKNDYEEGCSLDRKQKTSKKEKLSKEKWFISLFTMFFSVQRDFVRKSFLIAQWSKKYFIYSIIRF